MGTEHEDEPPLDPVLENVRRKLVRRMAWSLGIMMIGLMTVLGAIVYKISDTAEEADILSVNPGISIDIPDGAKVVTTSAGESHLLITLELQSGDYELVSVDRETGKVVSTIKLK